MQDTLFKFLAKALKQEGVATQSVQVDYFRQKLIALLKDNGWKKRFSLSTFRHGAQLYAKGGHRIVIERFEPPPLVENGEENRESVYEHTSIALQKFPYHLIRLKQEIILVGRRNGKKLRLWFVTNGSFSF